MSITRQNLSVVIVSFKSEHVIENCINSIDSEIEIVIIDNSNNDQFKKKIETKYKNVKCILSNENLGITSKIFFKGLLIFFLGFAKHKDKIRFKEMKISFLSLNRSCFLIFTKEEFTFGSG